MPIAFGDWRVVSQFSLYLWTAHSRFDRENRTFTDDHLKLLINYVRNAYPNAVTHFQSLDSVIQSLFANPSLLTTASVRMDHLHLQFNTFPEQVQCIDTDKEMVTATKSFLRILSQD